MRKVLVPRLKDLLENERRTKRQICDVVVHAAGSEKDLIISYIHEDSERPLNCFN